MSKALSTCPTCGQALADASLVARVRHNLEKLEAKRVAEFERKEKELRADVARERRQLQKTTEEKVRRSFNTKLREIEDRQKENVSIAVLKAREEERRRSDRALEQMRKQNEETQRRLQRLSADERGEIGEADIAGALQRAFPGDLIERLGKERGFADIRHKVREHGRVCGVIIYECKNVGRWSSASVRQARNSMAVHQASQAVLVSTAFPAGEKYLTFQKDVVVVHPSIVANVARTLRQVIVVRASNVGTPAERDQKAAELLQFVRGDDFRRSMKAVADAVADLQGIQAKERQTHLKVWESQRSLLQSIEANHVTLNSRVGEILNGRPSLALLESEEEETKSAAG